MTSLPGTTRDILELSLDIGGLPLIVADTAGLRATDDLVESIGIERAKSMCVIPYEAWLLSRTDLSSQGSSFRLVFVRFISS